MIDELINESRQRLSLMESKHLAEGIPSAEIDMVEKYINAHPDYTSYHLLFGIRERFTTTYSRVPQRAKANILCSALAELNYLNDWSVLDPDYSHDRRAASVLIETGNYALPCLNNLLQDRRPAPLFGTEEATLSSLYKYRRSDFAYRYVSLILGENPVFIPDPKKRDEEIEILIKRMRQSKQENDNI